MSIIWYIYNKKRRKNKIKFLVVMRILCIYSLYNFPTYHIAVLVIVTILHIPSLVLLYLITGSLYVLITFLQFPFPTSLASSNHESDFFLWICLFYEIPHISEIIHYLSFSDLVHLHNIFKVFSCCRKWLGFPSF